MSSHSSRRYVVVFLKLCVLYASNVGQKIDILVVDGLIDLVVDQEVRNHEVKIAHVKVDG